MTVIYYFSGTGNTLYLAREAARLLNGSLQPIAKAVRQDEVRLEADVIGIFYPVYYNGLPAVVREFAGKLRGLKDRYVFSVANYGGCGSQSAKILGELLASAGGVLSAAFGVHMPQNAFLKAWEKNDRVVEKGGKKIADIVQAVKAEKRVYL